MLSAQGSEKSTDAALLDKWAFALNSKKPYFVAKFLNLELL